MHPASIELLLDACPQDLERPAAVQDAPHIRAGFAPCEALQAVLFGLLDHLCASVVVRC